MSIENITLALYNFADSIIGDPNDLGIPKVDVSGNTKLLDALTLAFGIIAAISFLMVVIGGFRYVISIGEPQKIATARKTITYSLIGLIISLSATAIVAFVIGRIA